MRPPPQVEVGRKPRGGGGGGLRQRLGGRPNISGSNDQRRMGIIWSHFFCPQDHLGFHWGTVPGFLGTWNPPPFCQHVRLRGEEENIKTLANNLCDGSNEVEEMHTWAGARTVWATVGGNHHQEQDKHCFAFCRNP